MVVYYALLWFALDSNFTNKLALLLLILINDRDIHKKSHKYDCSLSNYLEKYVEQTDIKQQVTIHGLINLAPSSIYVHDTSFALIKI